MNKNIVHVVPSLSSEADGVACCVANLVDSSKEDATSTEICTLNYGPIRFPSASQYVKSFPVLWRAAGCSPEMSRWLYNKNKNTNKLLTHSHGLWMLPNIYAGLASKNTDNKLICSPHGTLSQWALKRSSLKKTIFNFFLQNQFFRGVDCFHATSISEAKDIRKYGLQQPIAIIPLGCEIPDCMNVQKLKQILFLSRIHPKKGVDILLSAWSKLFRVFPDWKLVIAGTDDGYLSVYKDLAANLKLDNCEFVGPVFGSEKIRLFSSSLIYVLPTHSDNFAFTVAESLAAGTPVVVSKGAPWEIVSNNNCGLWVDLSENEIVCALESLIQSGERSLIEMGINGRDLIEREYSWNSVRNKFNELYDWLIAGGEKPNSFEFY